jgi:hypothetical protein
LRACTRGGLARRLQELPDGYDRNMVECCCGEKSYFHEEMKHTEGCMLTRVTQKHDRTSPEGIAYTYDAVSCPNTGFWLSLPCTGGSAWQHVSRLRPGGEARLRVHYRLFRKLWNACVPIAEFVLANGGTVSIEWPAGCAYWHWPCVTSFLDKHGFMNARCDGCAFGLVSPKTGKPILKPWRIATTCKHIHDAMARRRCDLSHEHTLCRKRDQTH